MRCNDFLKAQTHKDEFTVHMQVHMRESFIENGLGLFLLLPSDQFFSELDSYSFRLHFNAETWKEMHGCMLGSVMRMWEEHERKENSKHVYFGPGTDQYNLVYFPLVLLYC